MIGDKTHTHISKLLVYFKNGKKSDDLPQILVHIVMKKRRFFSILLVSLCRLIILHHIRLRYIQYITNYIEVWGEALLLLLFRIFSWSELTLLPQITVSQVNWSQYCKRQPTQAFCDAFPRFTKILQIIKAFVAYHISSILIEVEFICPRYFTPVGHSATFPSISIILR